MHKGQEITNVKSFHEFGNDPIKMGFEHKIGMKITIKWHLILHITWINKQKKNCASLVTNSMVTNNLLR